MQCQPGHELDDHTIDQLATTVTRAEYAAIRTAPHTRALFWIGLLIGAEIAALAAMITTSARVGAWALIPALPAGIAVAVWATTQLRHRAAYRSTWRVAWTTTDHGTAVARICHDGADTYVVTGVAAWPLNTGLGGQLMGELTTWADQQHLPLTLHASSRRVARFYQRHGFTLTSNHRDRHLGYPMTRTSCIAEIPPYGGVTEHTPSVSAGHHPEAPQTPHPCQP